MGDVNDALSDGKGAGRDDLGRFVPGHTLGGRPRGYDIRTLAETAQGRTPAERLTSAYTALSEKADGGDVAAIKLLIELLCGKDPDKLDINYGGLSPAELKARMRLLIEDAFGSSGPA